ncbi:SDR family oxidoreductase [soil metagenome]
MNILITGGAGFIGSHLTKHYLSQNASVYIIDNLITGAERNIAFPDIHNLHFFNHDICDFDYSKLPEIDLAFHMASPASPIQYKKHPIETMLANSLGTYKLAEAMRNGKIKKLVLASTSEVYGDPLEHPQKETYFGNVNTLGPRSCYDESKRFAEAMLSTYSKKYGVAIRIARIFNTYGPNMEIDDGRVVSNFINQAITNKPITIYGDGTQTRSFCYVSDLVSGLIALGEKEGLDGEVINLGNPDEKTMTELATIIKEMTGTTSEIVYHPIDADDPKKRKPDISKANKLLAWEPKIDLKEGLEETIAYSKKSIL